MAWGGGDSVGVRAEARFSCQTLVIDGGASIEELLLGLDIVGIPLVFVLHLYTYQ